MTDPFVGTLTFFRVYSGVLQVGRHGVQPGQGARRNASGVWCRCTPTSARKSRKCAPATSPRRSVSRTSRPAIRCARRTVDHARADGVPRARDLRRAGAEDQGRSGEDGPRAQQARAGRPRRSACIPTRSPARRSSPAWASCTSRSSSTACGASSRSRPTSASRRSPTARPSARPSSSEGKFVRQIGRARPIRSRVAQARAAADRDRATSS